jgi:transporter family protein
MSAPLASWQFWAILSAAFAALTAIFPKIGVANVNADFVTLIRTVVICWCWRASCLAPANGSRPGP